MIGLALDTVRTGRGVWNYGRSQRRSKRDTRKYLGRFEQALGEGNYELAEHWVDELAFSSKGIGPEAPHMEIWMPQLKRRIAKARYNEHMARASEQIKEGDFESYLNEHDKANEYRGLMNDLDRFSRALSVKITGSLEALEPLVTKDHREIGQRLERLEKS